MSRGRAGVTFAEALVALLLGLLLVHMTLGTAARIRSAHATLMERADALLSFRIVASLLRTELHAGRAGQDWSFEADAIDLRAFRGVGLVCPEGGGADELVVSYTGYRSPDPSKDSVLVVDVQGGVTPLALEGVETGPVTCLGQPLERPLVLRVPGLPVRRAVVARIFERGSYSVSDAALRYRRGASGRQPLTPEVWTGSSRLRRDGAWLRADLHDGTSGEARGWHVRVARVVAP